MKIHNLKRYIIYITKEIFWSYRMKSYIEERAIEVANFIISSKATVRETAKRFGISKSTVHKDITERLENLDPMLAIDVRKVLEVNKAERHIRGGMATKEKYLHMEHK